MHQLAELLTITNIHKWPLYLNKIAQLKLLIGGYSILKVGPWDHSSFDILENK